MKQTIHVKPNIADYSLGLVSESEKREIALHIASCSECQLVLNRERQITIDIRDSLHQATTPDHLRLKELMPPRPKKFTFSFFISNWQPRLAVIGLVLILISGLVTFQTQIRQENWIDGSPTLHSTLAVVTDTPTITIPATRNELESADSILPTPLAKKPSVLPNPAIIPVPAAPILR